jgi:hypothetical protein
MGKSTISMAIFNSYVKLTEGNNNNSILTIMVYIVYFCFFLQKCLWKTLTNGGFYGKLSVDGPFSIATLNDQANVIN